MSQWLTLEFVDDCRCLPQTLWLDPGPWHFSPECFSIYVPNMTNPIILSVKMEKLQLPCEMKATVMDFQDILASPRFWSFREKAVGRRHGLLSKSNAGIELLVCLNSEHFFLCLWHATSMLVSSSVVVFQWKTVVSLISVWEVDNLKRCVAVVDSTWLYWYIDLPVPGTCVLQLFLPVKAEKIGSTESCRQWQPACWPLLISAWSCNQGSAMFVKPWSSQVASVPHILLYEKDQRRSRFQNTRSRYLARLLPVPQVHSVFCSHISRDYCLTSRNLSILS